MKIRFSEELKKSLGKKPAAKKEEKAAEPRDEYFTTQKTHLLGLANIISNTKFNEGALPNEVSMITYMLELDKPNMSAPLKSILIGTKKKLVPGRELDEALNYLPASYLEFILSDEDKDGIGKTINEEAGKDDLYFKIENGFAYTGKASFERVIDDLNVFRKQYGIEDKLKIKKFRDLIKHFSRACQTAVMKKQKIVTDYD